jgi:hypothetical protein
MTPKSEDLILNDAPHSALMMSWVCKTALSAAPTAIRARRHRGAGAAANLG